MLRSLLSERPLMGCHENCGFGFDPWLSFNVQIVSLIMVSQRGEPETNFGKLVIRFHPNLAGSNEYSSISVDQ
jgi:hypothetical protein